jgi:hypothetical protein
MSPGRPQEKDAEAGETDPEKQKLDSDDVEDGLEKVELNEVEVDGEVGSLSASLCA